MNPDGSFVHVLDDVSLDIVMNELDTVRDFTDYLGKKEEFVRSGQLLSAQGEENLLAYYAIRINEDGDHDFVVDDALLQ
ncbi:SEC-C motif domain protein [Sulfitobacter mediterraneus KCTC 32188]|nr:SEC-C motif domain protein [Sulfitobacter mediterraneus KCTC 32188]